MDFDKFMERDMIEFLDEKSMQRAEKTAGLREEEFDLYEITQDYTKDIKQALQDKDLRKAQKVFEDVKEKYNKAPQNSLSKKRLYIIMEEIFERIKDFEEKEEGEKSLFETIKEYEEKGLFKKPEAVGKQKQKEVKFDLITSIIRRKEEKLERILNKEIVRKEDLTRAIKEYRELKALIKMIPDEQAKQKSKIYDSALSWFYTIKKLKQGLIGKEREKVIKIKKEGTIKKKELPVEEKLARVRELQKKIVESHTKIVEYIKKKELEKSMDEYAHLRELCEEYPTEMEEKKTAILADALSLYEAIRRLQQNLSHRKNLARQDKEEEHIERQGRQNIRKEVHQRLNRVKAYLARKDSVNAVREYNELREVFRDYPEDPANEKNDLYKEILSAHKDIQLLENDSKRKSPAHESNRHKVDIIDQEIEQAHTLLDKGKHEEATQELLEAKHKIQMLPKGAFDDKYRLLKEIEKLEHKTLFVKNIDKAKPTVR